MANFTTHIAFGTVVSGALATLTFAADVVAPQNLVAVTLAGVLGSVIPDVDLKDSRASSAMFAGLGILLSFAVLFNTVAKFSVIELWILWLGTLVAVRYGLHTVFHRLSVHRGIWHSILAAVFAAIATASVYYYVLGRHEGVAWLAGAFMFVGYLTHLILDEVYSVDILDRRLKASFGTAFKVVDRRYPAASIAMLAATIVAIMVAPPVTTFVNGVGSKTLWTDLNSRLWPKDKWFGVIDPARLAWKQPQAVIETGSIPATAQRPLQTSPGAATGAE